MNKTLTLDPVAIRRIMKRRKISVSELSRRANITRDFVQNGIVKTNEPSDVRLSTAGAIARALGVRPITILTTDSIDQTASTWVVDGRFKTPQGERRWQT